MNAGTVTPAAPTRKRLVTRYALSLLIPLVLVGAMVLVIHYTLLSRDEVSAAVYQQTPNGWKKLPQLKGTPEDLRIGPSGAVWVRTMSWGGLSQRTADGWRSYDKSDFRTKENFPWGGFAIDGGQVWAATKEGVLRFDGTHWHLLPEGVKTEEAASVAAAGGEVWVIDESGNLSHYANGAWRIGRLDLPGVAWGPRPFSLRKPALACSRGVLWLVWHGLWRFDGRAWSAVRSLPDDVELAGSTAEHVWVKQKGRVWECDPAGHVTRDLRAADLGLPSNAVFHAVGEGSGRLVVSASAGLMEFDGSKWRRLELPGREVAAVSGLAFAPDGSLWVVGRFPGAAAPRWWLLLLMILLGVGGFVVLPACTMCLFKGMAERKRTDRAQMRAAVEYATGTVPENLKQVDLNPPSEGSPWRTVLKVLMFLVLLAAVSLLLFRYWPSAAPYGIVAVVVIWEIARSVQRRERKPSDPIGPGGPPRYDFRKSVKAVLSGLLVVLIPVGMRWLPGWWSLYLLGLLLLAVLVIGVVQFAAARYVNWMTEQGGYDAALRVLRLLTGTRYGTCCLVVRGEILMDAGRYEEAEQSLRETTERAGDEADRGLALESLGNVLMDKGRFEEAQRCFEGAAGMYPDRSLSWMGRAELLLRQAQGPERALEHVETALRLFQRNGIERGGSRARLGEILATKAWALAACDRHGEAIEAIEAALSSRARKSRPALAHVRYNAGMAMLAMGNRNAACDHFARGQECDPNGRWGKLCAGGARRGSEHAPVFR